MTRVEFVKLQRQEKAKLLCELAEFFFSEGNKVLITVSDENQAVTLDGFMWTWKKNSFIPHAYNNGAVDCLSEPILIEVGQYNPHGAEILIMGHPCPLEFMRQFRLVVDFAELYDPLLTEQSRERYARYKESGFVVAMR